VIGTAQVILKDGSTIALKDLKKNDILSNGAKVMLVVKYMVDVASMCNVDGVWITPWHPVNKTGTWVYPYKEHEIERVSTGGCVVDLILRPFGPQYFEMKSDAETIKCIGMAHEIESPSILKHGYWGSRKVLDDFKTHPEYETGVINIRNARVIRIHDSVIAQTWDV